MLQQDVIVAESKTQDEVLRERQAHAERTGRVIEVDNSDDDFHELPSKLLRVFKSKNGWVSVNP